ncbi:response regulator [Gordonia sp. NPDC003424]
MTARLAIVDDHALVRDALSAQMVAAGFDIVVCSGSLDDVVAQDGIDLLLLDLDLGPTGIADDRIVAALCGRGVAVVVVSALASSRHVRRMMAAGAAAVVSKNDALDDLQEAVRAALSGEKWMTTTIARAVLDDRDIERPVLSAKELEALRMYAGGMKLDSVARRMGIAPSTAKQYVDRVRRKYEAVGHPARTRSELFAAATDDGFIVPNGPNGSA